MRLRSETGRLVISFDGSCSDEFSLISSMPRPLSRCRLTLPDREFFTLICLLGFTLRYCLGGRLISGSRCCCLTRLPSDLLLCEERIELSSSLLSSCRLLRMLLAESTYELSR